MTDAAIRGGWREQTFHWRETTVRVRLPAAPDDYLEDLLESSAPDADLTDPYWAMLWPAAPLLATLILREPWPLGLRALEIGAGIGLAGLAGLVAGLDVTFSDHSPESVSLCAENARRNGFPQARSVLLDWRQPGDERFPLIFGSDVVYDRGSHELLWQLFERMLTEDGRVWLGDQGRFHTETFVAEAAPRGFVARLKDEHGQELTCPALNQFRLIELRRCR